MTLAKKKQGPRPSVPCLSARTVSPYVIDPMGRDSAWPGSYVSWFKGSCKRRVVLGSKQAAPISVSDSPGSSLGTVVMYCVEGSELALPMWFALWVNPNRVSWVFFPTVYFINEKRSIFRGQ